MSLEVESEEFIPPAPAFCERHTIDEMEIESHSATKNCLEELYKDVVNKLEDKKKVDSDEKERKTYEKVLQQSKLIQMVTDFFECDEEKQKAKFMNYLIDNGRIQDQIQSLEDKLNELKNQNKDLIDEKEHLNNIIESYEENERELQLKVIELGKSLNLKLEKTIQLTKVIEDKNRIISNMTRNNKILYFLLGSIFVSYLLLRI